MKKGMAAIWTILITVILMGGLGGGAWYYLDLQNTKDKDVMNKQIIDLENQIKTLNDAAKEAESDTTTPTAPVTTTADPYLYTNSTYGFSLQFNSKWQGYQMKAATITGATATYYICLPTTDTFYTQSSSTSLAGTASVFAFSVYTAAQWQAITAEEGPQPSKVGETGSWTVGYSSAQDYPNTAVFSTAVSDVANVIASFKAL